MRNDPPTCAGSSHSTPHNKPLNQTIFCWGWRGDAVRLLAVLRTEGAAGFCCLATNAIFSTNLQLAKLAGYGRSRYAADPMIEALADIGDFLGGVGVVVSLIYLAIQIRQNTGAVQSSSYHQSAEQMWAFCLSIAESESLAPLIFRDLEGGELSIDEQFRIRAAISALLFGFENCIRLRDQGLVDDEIWMNLMENSAAPLTMLRPYIEERPGRLSRRLLEEIDSRPEFAN